MVRNLPSPAPKQTRGGDGDGNASADEAISIGPTDNLQFAELRLPGIDGIGVPISGANGGFTASEAGDGEFILGY